MTPEQLRQLMPKLSLDKAALYVPHLLESCRRFSIDTVGRLAFLLGQIAHESDELTRWIEGGDGLYLEGRADLGNTHPGDGPRYKGHGPPQITGRKNHRACGQAIGCDLETNPELLLLPEWGFLATAWFWTTGAGLALSGAARRRLGWGVNLNDVADRLDIIGVSMAIQGGDPPKGLEARIAYTAKAFGVLAGSAPVDLGGAQAAGGLPLPS